MEKETECPCIEVCDCEDSCERRGNCAACITYHAGHQSPIACIRSKVSKGLEARMIARLTDYGLMNEWLRH